MFKNLSAAIFSSFLAIATLTSCASSSLGEPEKSILYNNFMNKNYPVTVIQCFEPSFDAKKGIDEQAAKTLAKCIDTFKKDKVQFDAWLKFLASLVDPAEQDQ